MIFKLVCVLTTVYLTAGEKVRVEKYWQQRESAQKQPIANVPETKRLAGKLSHSKRYVITVAACPKNWPDAHLLHLPDGDLRGQALVQPVTKAYSLTVWTHRCYSQY